MAYYLEQWIQEQHTIIMLGDVCSLNMLVVY